MWQEATGTSVVTGVSKGSGVVDFVVLTHRLIISVVVVWYSVSVMSAHSLNCGVVVELVVTI